MCCVCSLDTTSFTRPLCTSSSWFSQQVYFLSRFELDVGLLVITLLGSDPFSSWISYLLISHLYWYAVESKWLVELPKVGPITHADIEVALRNTRPSAHLHAHRYDKFNEDYGSQILQWRHIDLENAPSEFLCICSEIFLNVMLPLVYSSRCCVLGILSINQLWWRKIWTKQRVSVKVSAVAQQIDWWGWMETSLIGSQISIVCLFGHSIITWLIQAYRLRNRKGKWKKLGEIIIDTFNPFK